jgi:hypothetical protein
MTAEINSNSILTEVQKKLTRNHVGVKKQTLLSRDVRAASLSRRDFVADSWHMGNETGARGNMVKSTKSSEENS